MSKKFKNFNGGEMAFGLEVLLFVVAIFIIWVLMGGAKKDYKEGLMIKPQEGEVVPVGEFGN